MSSSVASSWMLVAITIQPSILRTATAFWIVRASAPALAFLVSVGEDVPFLRSSEVGGTASISISVDMVGRELCAEQRRSEGSGRMEGRWVT